MNVIETIFRKLFTAGIVVDVVGASLRVRPTALVTSELADLIREHKPALVAVLDRSADLPACLLCGGVQYAVPTFDGFENFECFACDKCSGCRKGVTL